MKLIVKKNKIARLNLFLDWLIYMVAYAIVLLLVSLIFKNTIQIDSSYLGIWGLITSIIIYLLNKTVKPIIVWLTLPITGVTMGLFYPFVNVIILYITDFVLGKHFEISGIIMAFIVALFISFMNIIMEKQMEQILLCFMPEERKMLPNLTTENL